MEDILEIVTAPSCSGKRSAGPTYLEYQSADGDACWVDVRSGTVRGVSTSGTCTIQKRCANYINVGLTTAWEDIATITVVEKQRPVPQTIGSSSLEVERSSYTAAAHLGEFTEVKFRMKNSGAAAVIYSMASASNWIIPTNTVGQVGGNENAIASVSLMCLGQAPQKLSGTLNITVAGETSAITIALDCIKRTELLSIRSWPAPSPYQARVGETVESGLHFGWYDDYLTNYGRGSVGWAIHYEATTNTPDVTIQDRKGTVTGATDQWQIYFTPYYYKVTHTCNTPGFKKIEFTLKVTFERRNYGHGPGQGIEGRVKKVPWHVNCLPNDTEAARVSFYQGPLISELRYHKKDNGWSINPYHASSLIEGRKTFVAVKLKHTSPIPPTLMARIGTTTVRAFTTQNSSDAGNYYTEYTYEVPKTSVQSNGRLLLSITAGSDFSSPHNTINIPFNQFSFLPAKHLKFHFVPIRRPNDKVLSKQSILNAAKKYQYKEVLEDFLPVSSITIGVDDEIVSDYDGLEGDRFRLITKHRYDREGKASETFYYGLYRCRDNGVSCLNKGHRGSLSAASGVDRGLYFPGAKTVAHEAGHGLTLGHPNDPLSSGYYPYQFDADLWPGREAELLWARPNHLAKMCGGEDADELPFGREKGWLMNFRRYFASESKAASVMCQFPGHPVFLTVYEYNRMMDYYHDLWEYEELSPKYWAPGECDSEKRRRFACEFSHRGQAGMRRP